MVVLAKYAKTDYGPAWPSITTLCSKTGYKKRNVQAALEELTDRGVIEGLKKRKDTSSIRILSGWRTNWRASVGALQDTSEDAPYESVSAQQRTYEDAPQRTYEDAPQRTYEDAPQRTQNQGEGRGLPSPALNEPILSPPAQELAREKPLFLATPKQVQLVGKVLKEKGVTFQDLRSAWGRIPGLCSETPPNSFDSFNADDVSVVIEWLKGKGKLQEQPVSRVVNEPPGEPAGEAFEWVAQDVGCAETWAEALTILKGKVTGPIFRSQLEDTQGWARQGDDFVVVCRNEYSIRRLRGDMETMMRDALLRASGGELLTLKLVAKGDESDD